MKYSNIFVKSGFVIPFIIVLFFPFQINEKFNEIGFGNAIKMQLITKRETLRVKGADETCT